MIMVNDNHVLCCFIDCLLKQVFQKFWVLSIEGWHQPNSIEIQIKLWLTLTMYHGDEMTHMQLPQGSPFQCAASYMAQSLSFGLFYAYSNTNHIILFIMITYYLVSYNITHYDRYRSVSLP